MASHAHSTRTPLLRPVQTAPTLLGQGLDRQPGPVTEAIRTMREAEAAIAAIEDGLDRHFAAVDAADPTTRPALAKRAAALRRRLEARSSRKSADPHIPHRDRLIAAHAAAMAVRSVFQEEHPDSPTYKAALAVDNRMWALIADVLSLPAPKTAAGLAVVGLALAFQVEGALAGRPWENEDKIAAAARAILAVTGTVLPPAFTGFGDEVAA
ncbi:hypothetical protein MKK75_19235 [Methylobacterium sp. J-030]|uniref:hypothetical protein n=1 Tax=Methylobacterium sp. J-030 TaxID=2836627 RepID=UPI001FBBEFAF|nr:hypothetical protein [Methylobacterium sp. J-030]MCJ2070897.1 hypothetical protein [Methylobacterium sp. J-030]